jgi:NADH-quinone oxidoreductase subunit H
MIFATDPLYLDGVDLTDVVVTILKVGIAFVFLLVATMFMVWFERKVIADLQNRIGPNKAGPFGLLQTLADGIKAFFKEDNIPDRADRFVFKLAPYLSLVPAFLVFAIVPIGGDWSEGKDGIIELPFFDVATRFQVADPPIGILFLLAMSSVAVYGVMLAGWSSGSKYPLLGSVRATAQMVSYEAAMGMSVATVLLVTGTLTTSGIVGAQDRLADWNLVATGVLPFIIFFIASTAELNRPPFDLVEAEQELVGGFHTEYAGVRFALFYLAEFMNTVTMSAIVVTLFLGGPRGLFDIPLIPNNLESILWFFAKLFVFLFVQVWIRATLPRFRYDQLMDLGWKVLIPLAFGWFLFLTSVRVARDQDWNVALVAVGAIAVAFAGYLLLVAALRVSARERAAAEGSFY